MEANIKAYNRARQLAENLPLSKEEMIEGMYEEAEKYWVKCGYDSEDFDWICFTDEIRNRAYILGKPGIKDPTIKWEAILDNIVERFRKWYNLKMDREESHLYPTNEQIANALDKYQKQKEIELVPPPPGYKTVTRALNEEQVDGTRSEIERECDSGEEDFSDDDDEFYAIAEEVSKG
jgi:hypothetical protein